MKKNDLLKATHYIPPGKTRTIYGGAKRTWWSISRIGTDVPYVHNNFSDGITVSGDTKFLTGITVSGDFSVAKPILPTYTSLPDFTGRIGEIIPGTIVATLTSIPQGETTVYRVEVVHAGVYLIATQLYFGDESAEQVNVIHGKVCVNDALDKNFFTSHSRPQAETTYCKALSASDKVEVKVYWLDNVDGGTTQIWNEPSSFLQLTRIA